MEEEDVVWIGLLVNVVVVPATVFLVLSGQIGDIWDGMVDGLNKAGCWLQFWRYSEHRRLRVWRRGMKMMATGLATAAAATVRGTVRGCVAALLWPLWLFRLSGGRAVDR